MIANLEAKRYFYFQELQPQVFPGIPVYVFDNKEKKYYLIRSFKIPNGAPAYFKEKSNT